jgi:hypothetical protein
VIYFGDYIPQQIIESWWFKNYASHRSKMAEIKRPIGVAWYIAKYLKSDDYEASYYSHNWVFPGWIGFSKWIKKEFNDYPPREMLKDYALKTSGELLKDAWYSLYLD